EGDAVPLGDADTPAVAVGVGEGNGPFAVRSYASTKPTPVPLFTPESKTVYCPGANVVPIHDSRGFVGGPGSCDCRQYRSSGSSIQSLLDRISAPLLLRNSSCGLAKTLGMPNCAKLGPIPRKRMVSS